MAVAIYELEMKLVGTADGLEVDLLPLQGLWTAQQYLKITDQTNRLIEFTDGVLEILPMPTDKHQNILEFLYDVLHPWMRRIGGKVHVPVLRVQIREDRFREPDLLLVRDAHDQRRQNSFWRGADLVVEIVSPDDPERDIVVKRGDYAEAGIPEYWIVNPLDETITVLTLVGTAYSEHGVFRRGEMAHSVLLAGFAVSVAEVFDAD
jgi:Uma2 family endonuclease